MDPFFCYCEHICGCAHHVKLDWESHAGVMIYDQIKPVVFFFFFFFSVLGGAVISRFLNSASFLWSPPLCGALRGSWGGDTHAHDMFRVTDGIPAFSFLPRYYSFPSRFFTLMWCIHASFITEWWSVCCVLLLLAQRWRGTVPSTPNELQKPVKNQWMHLTSF